MVNCFIISEMAVNSNISHWCYTYWYKLYPSYSSVDFQANTLYLFKLYNAYVKLMSGSSYV